MVIFVSATPFAGKYVYDHQGNYMAFLQATGNSLEIWSKKLN
jgi:hypothetical protein